MIPTIVLRLLVKIEFLKLTGSYRIGDHGYDGNEYGSGDVNDGENEVNFNWSRQVRLLPSKVGNADDGQTNGQPRGETDVVDQGVNVFEAQIDQTEKGHEEDGRHRGQMVNLNHRQNFRHLTVFRPGEKQPATN